MVEIIFTEEELAQRAEASKKWLRDRWTVFQAGDGYRVSHVVAGEVFIRIGDQAFPLRWDTRAEAEAWLEAELALPRSLMPVSSP